jgi:hypothetical protein
MNHINKQSRRAVSATAVLAVLSCGAFAAVALAEEPALRGPPPAKAHNWTPPAYKLTGQALVERIKARHPELLSLSIHCEVPSAGISTLAFSANPAKIGEPDGPDDRIVMEKGYTIIDHRWRRIDPTPKLGISTPLRNVKGENIGLLVVIFKNDPVLKNDEVDLYRRATEIRAEFQREIPNRAWMFQPAQ